MARKALSSGSEMSEDTGMDTHSAGQYGEEKEMETMQAGPLAGHRPDGLGHAQPASSCDCHQHAAHRAAQRTEDAKFLTWMAKVDAALLHKCSMDSRDLPDVCYHDMFDDGCSPAQAANFAIAEAGGF